MRTRSRNPSLHLSFRAESRCFLPGRSGEIPLNVVGATNHEAGRLSRSGLLNAPFSEITQPVMRCTISCSLRFLSLAVPALCVLGALCVMAPSAGAQGCPMCYRAASQAGKLAVQALHSGILVLLVPTLLLFVGILVFTFRRAAAAE